MAVYRTLSLPADRLDDWFDLLAHSFKAKGTPRSYFERHWFDDPSRDCDDVIVVVDDHDTLVSSTRIFRRSLHLGTTIVPLGGIGEVATRPGYEGRGLARQAVDAAVHRMSITGILVSLLHTSSAVGLYRKLGYVSVPLPLASAALPPPPDAREFKISFIDSSDVSSIAPLHARHVVNHAGGMPRARASDWAFNPAVLVAFERGHLSGYAALKAPAPDRVVVCEMVAEHRRTPLDNVTKSGTPLDNAAKCETPLDIKAASDSTLSDADLGEALRQAVWAAIDKQHIQAGAGATVRGYGSVVARAIRAMSPSEGLFDEGFMYRLIAPFSIEGREIGSTEALCKAIEEKGHLFMGLDAF